MIPLGILTGILVVALTLLVWRLARLAGERTAALQARDEALAEADQVRKDSKGARDDLEAKRREVASLQAEQKELKKKLYDSKEEVRRRGGLRARQDEEERTYESRLREMNAALEMAREEVVAAKKLKEQAERSLGELQELRDKVAALEAAKGGRSKREPAPSAAPAAGSAEETAQLRRKLAERERAIDGLRRKTDNANRIYLVTKSQLDLAQEKIASLGLRYAEAVAKLEGRPPPLGAKRPKRSAAATAAEEAEALAEALDESDVEESSEETGAESTSSDAVQAQPEVSPPPPAAEPPAAEPPAAEPPAAETSAADTSAADTSAADTPAAKTPAAETKQPSAAPASGAAAGDAATAAGAEGPSPDVRQT